MKNTIKNIRHLTQDELKEAVALLGEKPFRGSQVYEWIWKKSAQSFEEMSNLPKAFRELLAENFTFDRLEVDTVQHSKDKTLKLRFKTFDGHFVEGVLIPVVRDGRFTACVSSQVGCSLTCKFCATGYMDRKRNLNADEIYDQVVHINKLSIETFGHPLSNIVFMGMGEPLLNYKNVLSGIEKITSPEGLHMSSKRITVSTAGVAKMIQKLADDDVKFNLALSLHAANDTKRSKIMPINDQNNLEVLAQALNYFYDKTKSMITFEYIIFDQINDNIEDAEELVAFCRKVPSKVNIIEYNPIREADFKFAKEDRVDAFVGHLLRKKIIAKVRRSRGKDIDAACGQLANK